VYDFRYHRPTSLADAVSALEFADDARLLAGGMSLLPTLKLRLSQPSDLIDLSRLGELRGIQAEAGGVRLGAMATHAEVASSEAVRETIPALADLAGSIGDPQVRNRGTIGGSIANADPAADYPAALVGLCATVHTNQREIGADDYFTGLFETSLEAGELVTAVSFPKPGRAAYMKFANPASRYAIVGVMVAQTADGVRVAVTGAGSSVFRVAEMESALADDFSPSALEGITVSPDELNEDLHASAEYRAHLVGVMAKRAVVKAGGG
jgi:carbon-monoxide dehydrogenase medium subunit